MSEEPVETPEAFKGLEIQQSVKDFKRSVENLKGSQGSLADLRVGFRSEASITAHIALAQRQLDLGYPDNSHEDADELSEKWANISLLAEKAEKGGLESLTSEEFSIVARAASTFYVANILPEVVLGRVAREDMGITRILQDMEKRIEEVKPAEWLLVLRTSHETSPSDLETDYYYPGGEHEIHLPDDKFKGMVEDLSNDPGLAILAKSRGSVMLLRGDSRHGERGGWSRNLYLSGKGEVSEGISFWGSGGGRPQEEDIIKTFKLSNGKFTDQEGEDLFEDRVFKQGYYDGYLSSSANFADSLTKNVIENHPRYLPISFAIN